LTIHAPEEHLKHAEWSGVLLKSVYCLKRYECWFLLFAVYTKPKFSYLMGAQMAEAEICLVNSGTTNTISRETRYFQTLNKKNGNIMTIARSNAHIVGIGSATLVLSWVLKYMWGYTPFIAIGKIETP
jgi:hypothetical protein